MICNVHINNIFDFCERLYGVFFDVVNIKFWNAFDDEIRPELVDALHDLGDTDILSEFHFGVPNGHHERGAGVANPWFSAANKGNLRLQIANIPFKIWNLRRMQYGHDLILNWYFRSRLFVNGQQQLVRQLLQTRVLYFKKTWGLILTKHYILIDWKFEMMKLWVDSIK